MIRWQKPMIAVLIALIPCAVSAVYRFGWRTMAVVGTATLFAFMTEWLFARKRGEPVTSAVFVSAALLSLSLPPALPLWVAAIGAVTAILFGKEVFGGFGRNVFNPALVGRCFIYVCFPLAMTGRWSEHAAGFPGGFRLWATPPIEAVTGATPLDNLARGQAAPYLDLLLGNRNGSIGETFTIAILVGAVFLLWRKAADWKLMAGPLLGMLAMSAALWLSGVKKAPDPLWAVLGGGFMYVAVFMTTEPVSAAKTTAGKWVYGVTTGALTSLMRVFGAFPESATFAVLLMNAFNPSLDCAVKAWQASRKGAS